MPLGSLSRGLAVGATILALIPASALAQGAGDDQYSDPFGSDQEQATPTPTAAPRAPAPQATAAPAQTTSTPAPGPAATPVPSGPRLPYTGLEDWLSAAGGALLLGAGLLLRARLREPDERT